MACLAGEGVRNAHGLGATLGRARGGDAGVSGKRDACRYGSRMRFKVRERWARFMVCLAGEWFEMRMGAGASLARTAGRDARLYGKRDACRYRSAECHTLKSHSLFSNV